MYQCMCESVCGGLRTVGFTVSVLVCHVFVICGCVGFAGDNAGSHVER